MGKHMQAPSLHKTHTPTHTKTNSQMCWRLNGWLWLSWLRHVSGSLLWPLSVSACLEAKHSWRKLDYFCNLLIFRFCCGFISRPDYNQTHLSPSTHPHLWKFAENTSSSSDRGCLDEKLSVEINWIATLTLRSSVIPGLSHGFFVSKHYTHVICLLYGSLFLLVKEKKNRWKVNYDLNKFSWCDSRWKFWLYIP